MSIWQTLIKIFEINNDRMTLSVPGWNPHLTFDLPIVEGVDKVGYWFAKANLEAESPQELHLSDWRFGPGQDV